MAATVTPTKVAVNLKLDAGTTASGDVKTVNVGLGKLSVQSFNADKALAIANLIEPCLSKSIYILEKVETSRIDEE
ncbi:MAG: hypothetical protein II954_04590 [Synergistaceae bacterium]|nr:hypothetical protein [Synergistaceae bacterium]